MLKKSIFVLILVLSAVIQAQTNTFPDNGDVGVGTISPKAGLHVKSASISETSTTNHDANFIIEGTDVARSMSKGATLGFVVPANTNGANPWQQGRIMVTPDDQNNGYATGRMLLQTRYLSNGSWRWNNNLVLKSSGYVGVGTTSPKAGLHVKSASISETSTTNHDANFIIEGTDVARSMSKGATLGFVVPANTNGANPWQQGRIMVTPDDQNNGYATGRMLLQTRYLSNGSWRWNNNLVLKSSGYVGVGTTSPKAGLHVKSASISETSTTNHDANFIIEGTDVARSMSKGATLGFVVPANTNGGNPWQQGRIMVTPDNESNGYATGRMLLQTRYLSNGSWQWNNNLVLKSNGNVGIGTTNPDSKLTVKGKIHAEEVKIDLSVPAPDYVFKKEYDLLTIDEVQQHIQEKGHLPNIPSAKVMETEGVDLGIMNMKLLEKIEELTLYTIEQENRINSLEKKLEILLNNK